MFIGPQYLDRILRIQKNFWLESRHRGLINKRHWIVANSYQRSTNDLLMRSSKTNHERTTRELTIWLTIDDCLTVTIDGSKPTNYWLRVFIANNNNVYESSDDSLRDAVCLINRFALKYRIGNNDDNGIMMIVIMKWIRLQWRFHNILILFFCPQTNRCPLMCQSSSQRKLPSAQKMVS